MQSLRKYIFKHTEDLLKVSKRLRKITSLGYRLHETNVLKIHCAPPLPVATSRVVSNWAVTLVQLGLFPTSGIWSGYSLPTEIIEH